MNKQACCQRVYYGWSSGPCGNKGKVERDGKWYCGVHDPERKKKRLEAREAGWRAENERRDALRRDGQRRCDALGAGRPHGDGGVYLRPDEADDLIRRLKEETP